MTKITLKTGKKIYCLPVGASAIGIRGLTIGRLYIDEASRLQDSVFSAISPMLLTTGGDTILLSTPFGAQGEFWRVWINKDGAYDSFSRFSATSEIVMRERPINEFWTERQREKALIVLDQAKSRMSKREYAQEYLGEFVEDLFRYFSDELIKQCCILKRPESIPKKSSLYLGVDIARLGEDEGTYEIIQKIDNNNIRHIESMITVKKRTNETTDLIVSLERLYNFDKIYIDAGSGSLGVGILDSLLAIDETKRKVIALDNRRRALNRDGTQQTRLLKEDLYDNLRSLMEKGAILLLDDEKIIDSLMSVQYEYVMSNDQPTRIRIFGNYTHIVEGLIRACYGAKEKSLNIWLKTIKL